MARADLGRIAVQRRELRESRKRLHAPPIIPTDGRWTFGPFDMSAFETQKRNADDAETLSGFAVSPGTVTGVVNTALSKKKAWSRRLLYDG